MIIVYHQYNRVSQISVEGVSNLPITHGKSISKVLISIAKNNPKELLVWCHESCKELLNIQELDNIFHHNEILASYNCSKKPYLSDGIGYVTESPFININKDVVYPTWLMSSDVGGINAAVLLALEIQLLANTNFDYFLNSIAKLCMPLGLFCYSSPKLLKSNIEIETKCASKVVLFKFVKQHYKTLWVFLLFLDFAIYEKKFPIIALFSSLFYKRRTLKEITLNQLYLENGEVSNSKKIELDVIIPTIGRKAYLYNVLKDLSKQTILPKQVIIVEQNPKLDAKSELDYLTNEAWPFKINHHFTHKTGACNARNIALKMVKSDWVFLADDDIVLKNDFIEKANKVISKTDFKAFTFNCHLKNETPKFKTIKQWKTFGSGCSFVKASAIKTIFFSMAFEHGFGEDADFGLQLRNKGIDVLYIPQPSILHLKAPIGGFRSKPEQPWHEDAIQPKPSPTVMLYLQKHQTKTQLLGYKTILFLKYYKLQPIKNPFRYFRMFKKQWGRSQFWTNQLKE